MKVASIFQAFFILVFVLFTQAHAATTYQLDDGTGTTNVTATAGGLSWVWMNQFDAVGGTDQITSVGIAWGQDLDGTSARLTIWDDPDNDGSPVDRALLNYIDVLISGGGIGGTDSFIFYDIVDTLVAGSFFVGVEFTNANTFQGYPARIDQTLSSGRSWIGSIDNTTIPMQLIDTIGFPGNWMIRANGSGAAPVPEPSTILMLGAGLLGLLATTRRSAIH